MRPILDITHIHPAIHSTIRNHQQDIITQVQTAIAQHPIVVVGMRFNPFPGKACRALAAAGLSFEYLEFGSYFSQWRRRNALKMWTGWPTFPMVFIRGQLVGGFSDVNRLIKSGEIHTLLAAQAPQ